MQCLRCSNEAVIGKALCAECLAHHQSKLEVEQSEEWVQEKLRTSRKNIRKISKEQKSLAEEFQGVMTKLSPYLIVLVIVIALGPTLFKAKPLPAPAPQAPILAGPKAVDAGPGSRGEKLTGDRQAPPEESQPDLQAPSGDSQPDTQAVESDTEKSYGDTPLAIEPTIGPTAPALTEVPTATPTETPTATPTVTPTETPTVTPG